MPNPVFRYRNYRNLNRIDTPQVVVAGNHDATFQPAHYDKSWARYSHAVKQDPAACRAALTAALYLEVRVRVRGLGLGPRCTWR